MQYLVITKVPDAPNDGNLAIPGGHVYVDTEMTEQPETPRYRDFGLSLLALRQPVFMAGEVLITDDGERECVGLGRKPSKWDVEYETFDNIEDAVALARTVMGMEGL